MLKSGLYFWVQTAFFIFLVKQKIMHKTFHFCLLFINIIALSSCQESKPVKQAIESLPNEEINPTEQALQNVLDTVFQNNPKAVGIMAYVESPKQAISWQGWKVITILGFLALNLGI